MTDDGGPPFEGSDGASDDAGDAANDGSHCHSADVDACPGAGATDASSEAEIDAGSRMDGSSGTAPYRDASYGSDADPDAGDGRRDGGGRE
jgi:hypothetical protein